MSDANSNLVPLYQLDHICADPYLRIDLRMMHKRSELQIGRMLDRAGEIEALDTATIQKLIDTGKITLKPADDDTAWRLVGGYEHFMQKYGLRPKA